MNIRALVLVLFFVLMGLPCYAQNTNVSNGITWLLAQQNADGSFGTNSSTYILDTTETVNALKLYGNSAGLPNAATWLSAQNPSTVDELARNVVSLSSIGMDTTDAVTMLVTMRNPEMGWGYQSDYVSTPLDTALALQALRASNYPDLSISNNALAYLTNTQNTDGGWGFSSGDPSTGSGQADSSIYITAIVSATLQKFPQTIAIANAFTRASAYLIAQQNIDGGFGVTASGTSASTVFETSLAYIALIGDGQTGAQQAAPLRALTYLTSSQSLNGSWNDDPYSTALAIRALYYSENPFASPPPPLTSAGVMGTIVDNATGLPLAGVAVTLVGNSAITASSDASGVFVLSGIASGRQQITLSIPGFAPFTITATLAAGDFINAGRISLTASAATTGTVMGLVWDATLNAPFPGVTVRVLSGGATYTTISGADGSFRIANIPAGSVTLSTPDGPPDKPPYWNVSTIATLPAGGILVYNPRLTTTQPPSAVLYLRSDKALYQSADSVALSVDIQNNRSTPYPATLKLRVTDPDGANLFDTSLAVDLAANAMLTQNGGFTLPVSAKGGTYTAVAELYDGGNLLLNSATSVFTLHIVPITVSPRLPAQFSQGENSIPFDLVNNRTVAVSSGTLALTLKDPDGQIAATASQPFTLAPGEAKTVNLALTFPALKFGSYTLVYTQSDEATSGVSGENTLPNNVTITASFDKFSYKAGDTANLQVTLNNTGRFNLDGASLNVAVEDTGYSDAQTLTITSGTPPNLQNAIPVPAGTGSGEHATTVTLTLPGGAAASTAIPCRVAQAIVDITPADASREVPVRAAVMVRLSESVDPASITSAMVTLSANGAQVPGSVGVTGDGVALVFKSQDKLAYATAYTFTVKAAARTQSGNSTVIDLTTTFSTPLLDPDLVGYWPMDGDWKDYSGKGNNAEAYGSATFTTGRYPGVTAANFAVDSASFQGSGGYVPTAAEYIADAPNTFTIAFWASPDATRTSTAESQSGITGIGNQSYAIAPVIPVIAGAGAGVSVGTNGISVFEQNGSISEFFGNSTSSLPSLLVYDAPTPLNGWNHIVVVYNNKQPSLYLNGQFIKTGLASQEEAVYPSIVFGDVFGNSTPGYGPYSGGLGEINIYKRAFSAQEIQSLYRQTPQIAITSPGQTVKYKPGETGSATVTADATAGISKLYCMVNGAANGPALAMVFDPFQPQTTQQLAFKILPDSTPFAPYLLSCTAETVDGVHRVYGVGELEMLSDDTAPPTVVSSTPTDNAIDVSATMPLTVTFSEPMDGASIISRSSFKFQRADTGAFVTGMFGISADGKTIMIVPSPALEAGTAYTITFSGVRDRVGNPLATDYVLHFTTLQQLTLTVEDQGAQASPYVLPAGRYGALTLNNSFVSISGGVTADSISVTSSTVNVTAGAQGAPGYFNTTYGDMQLTESQLSVNGEVIVTGNLNMDSSTLTLKNTLQTTGNISLTSNSLLTHFAATTTDTSKLDITAAHMSIDTTSKIDVSGKGYLGGYQRGDNPFSNYRYYVDCYGQSYVPAAGENASDTGRTIGNTTTGGSSTGNGGSYGGMGGFSSGSSNTAYGDPANPNDLGSGGGGYNDLYFSGMCYVDRYYSGGNGGGLIRLSVASLNLEGSIIANGADAEHGGGSGGGIRIDAVSISGLGTIIAKGGDSSSMQAGGGGGGRIAIYYSSMTLPVANMLTFEGNGNPSGGTGTIYIKNSTSPTGDLIITSGNRDSKTVLSAGTYGTISVTNATLIAAGDIIASTVVLYNSVMQTTKLTTNTASLTSNSMLTHPETTTNNEYRLELDVFGALSIDATSKIDVSGRGYLGGHQGDNSGYAGRTFGNTTAGGSAEHNGGSYGGLGGVDNAGGITNAIYGDPTNPNESGSGGGGWAYWGKPGGNGGGLVRLKAGALILDGSIVADGVAVERGGGSGGGIRIDAATISGLGSISATGGVSYGGYGGIAGGGGGGRIAIYYETMTLPGTNITASGGSGNPSGGAGTVYLKSTLNNADHLIVDNLGMDTAEGSTTLRSLGKGTVTDVLPDTLTASGMNWQPGSLIGMKFAPDIANSKLFTVIDNTATALKIDPAEGDLTQFTELGLTFSGTYVFTKLTVKGKGRLTGLDRFIIEEEVLVDGSTLVADAVTANKLSINNSGLMSHWRTTTNKEYGLELNVTTLLSIDATSKIDVNGRGYLGGHQGDNSGYAGRTFGNTTAGGSAEHNGGSYGGLGGVDNTGGITNAIYGDPTNPNESGSGGGGWAYWGKPGGNGGGLVRLKAGALILDGSIVADGVAVERGGGSGGGIRIDAATISGLGSISAKGGVSYGGYGGIAGGGGGGRIAIYSNSITVPLANISASGGSGNPGGGTGTIYRTPNLSPVEVVVSPASGSTDVPLDTTISVSFIDSASFITSLVSLDLKGASVPGSVTFLSDGTTLVFKPNLILSGGQTYTFTIKAGTRDAAGHIFGTDQIVTFSTPSIASILIENRGTAASPYTLASGRYETVTMLNSYVVLDGPLNAGNVNINSNTTLTQKQTGLTGMESLDLTVTGILSIDSTSKIDVSNRGYLGGSAGGNGTTGRTYGNTGTGGSANYNGGSYGGMGGLYSGVVASVYGDPLNPNEPGSGGGSERTDIPGGNGGGLVLIKAGTLALAGNILADGGGAKYRGSGSGGGIRIDADSISGNGFIYARGGGSTDPNTHGGGGGGRIAIYYGTIAPEITVVASGGSAIPNGGAGTVYLKSTIDGSDHLIVDNRGVSTGEGSTVFRSLGSGTVTGVTPVALINSAATWQPGAFKGMKFTPDLSKSRLFTIVDNDATTLWIDSSEGDLTQATAVGLTYAGSYTFTRMSILGKGRLSSLDRFVIGNELLVDGSTLVANNVMADRVTVKNSSMLSHWPTTISSEYRLDLNALTALSIDSTSKIDVSNRGYLGGSAGGNGTTGRTYGNTGTGGSANYNGGSYGGMGGLYSGVVASVYGDPLNPNEPGSGGGSERTDIPGGNGGGLVRIKAGAVVLDGSIFANGGGSWARGSGSGGGIRIDADSISGNGFIYARGGGSTDPNTHGGGGGGRIAIYYGTMTLPLANVVASGGIAKPNGNPGTTLITPNAMPLAITTSGSGTISSTPAGISCGAACTSQFTTFSTVTLAAAPAPGYTFVGWSGACTGPGSCTVTMDAARNVSATFTELTPPTVVITTPSGVINNNRPTLLYSVSEGTVVVRVDGVAVDKDSGSALDILADGLHVIRVEATNSVGSVGFAETTILIDTMPPSLTVTPVPTPTSSASLTLGGTLEAGAGLAITATSGATIGSIDIAGGTWSCLVSNLSPGLNAFAVTAADAAGNTSMVNVSATYIPPLAIAVAAPSIPADHQGAMEITVSNVTPSGSEVLIEQYIDSNRNGLADAGDTIIRAFKVSDGLVAPSPNMQGDEDGSSNGIITTSLNYRLINDLYHAPGHYLFKATTSAETATIPFVVDPVSQLQTISGIVTAGTTPLPGAIVQLQDKWQRPMAWAIADDSGAYVMNVNQPGDYTLAPSISGYVAPLTAVTLAASQSLVNQTLTLTPGTYHVSGTLKDASSGTGIAGVRLQASDGINSSLAMTDNSGGYDLVLPSGQYALSAYPGVSAPGACAKGYAGFNNLSLSATVSGNMTGMDILLTKGDILVSGRLLDVSGNPVQGLAVMGRITRAADSREPASFGSSAADGTYSLGLFSGTNWEISLDNNSAQTAGYIGTVHRELSTAAGPLSNNDLTVHPVTARVQGVVKNSADQLLPGVEVRLRNNDSSISASVVTVQDGSYQLGAFAGAWFIDALTESSGTHSVTEQTFVLSAGQTTAIDFVVDITPPTLLVNPVTTPTRIDSQTISGSMEAGAAITISVNTAAAAAPVNYLTATTWSSTISGLVEGANVITVTAMDVAENPSVATATITLDTLPPTVAITSPTSGITASQTPLLTYTASDGAIVVKVDDVIVNKISDNTLDTLSFGTHTVRVEATDAAGNSGSDSVTFTVNQPPLFSPAIISKANATVGVAYTGQTIANAAADPDGDAITYAKVSGPAWLTVAADGTLSGTPASAASDSFIVRATATGGTAEATLNITVAAVPAAVAQLNAWTNLYSAAPKTTSKTNLAAGSFTVGSGTNRLLLVAVIMEIGTPANPSISASYGGTVLTLLKTTASTEREIVWVGYLKETQIGSGSKALTVTYSGAKGKARALHVKWAAFSGVNQTAPVVSSGGTNTSTKTAQFGNTINYVVNGMTTAVAGNGGTPATGALSATPAFTAGTATTSNAQTSRTFTTATHTAAGSYAGSQAVSWSGTARKWSGVVAVSLQP